MLDLNAKYEILSFSVGDTKAGTKMGKMQLKKLEDNSILNCVLWEEALNRLPDIALRTGNIIRIITGSYNEKYNNCLLNNFEVLDTASLGIDKALTTFLNVEILVFSFFEIIEFKNRQVVLGMLVTGIAGKRIYAVDRNAADLHGGFRLIAVGGFQVFQLSFIVPVPFQGVFFLPEPGVFFFHLR